MNDTSGSFSRLGFFTAPAAAGTLVERMSILPGGNVGIGTSAPEAKLSIVATNGLAETVNAANTTLSITDTMANGTSLNAFRIQSIRRDMPGPYGSTWNFSGTRLLSQVDNNATAQSWMDFFRHTATGNNSVAFGSGTSEWMRIYNGNLSLGTTAAGGKMEINSGSAGALPSLILNTTTVGAHNYQFFRANGTTIGSITSAAGANVAFNTTSDIRLKAGFSPVATPLKTLSEIEVENFYYLSDFSRTRMDGFKAQQLYRVLPYAVTRPEKEVDDEGKIVPWQADYSKVVPLLTAAVQELYRKVLGMEEHDGTQDQQLARLKQSDELKSREIASLKAKAEKAERENAMLKARLEKIEKMLSAR